jgi:hypothetical protein
MGGENAFLAHLLNVGFGSRAKRAAAELPLKQRQGEQGCVALVHVVNVDPVAQRMHHANAAHAEHNLLLKAVVGVSAVEVVGEAAIPSGVAVHIRVEEVDRHYVSVAADEVITPRAHGNGTVLYGDGNPGGLFGAEVGWIPGLDILALHSGFIKVLPEVALAVQQREGYQGHAEVGGGTQRVTGEHSQAARVGGHSRVDRNLHREVGNQS